MDRNDPPFEAVDLGYRQVVRVRLAIAWIVLLAIAFVADRILLGEVGIGGILPGAVFVADAGVTGDDRMPAVMTRAIPPKDIATTR